MATLQEAREVWKLISDEDFDAMLWTCTPYPCNDESDVADFLIKIHPKFDGDVKAAIKIHSDEFDKVWEEHKRLVAARKAAQGNEFNED